MIAANGKVPDAEHSDLVPSTQRFVSLSSNEATHPESETSTDELALEVGMFTSSSHRTPVRAQTNLPPKVSRINNPWKRLKSRRGLARDLKPHKSSIENPGSSVKKHICGGDGVRKSVYQHNPLQLSCITGNTDSAAGRLDGVHSRFRHSQGCAWVCNTTKGPDGGDRRRAVSSGRTVNEEETKSKVRIMSLSRQIKYSNVWDQ